tara:strand:- start:39 stop:980 length:942 start_codon:yes stop_codon:yes gene_type:complete
VAYQNVGTPRFYVNVLEWMASQGVMEIHNIMRTLPVDNSAAGSFSLLTKDMGMKAIQEQGFIAILGHNIKDIGASYSLSDGITSVKILIADIVNRGTAVGGDYDAYAPSYSGFSIGTFNGNDLQSIHLGFTTQIYAGSVLFGTYYDMPHSPDLKLTMTREGGGTKRIRSKNGSSFSNSFYTKPPMWGEGAAWELYSSTTTHKLARSGRRIWDLSWSYLSDSSIFPETASLSRMGEDGYSFSWNNYLDNTLLTDDNFFSQVIHKTNGGELPFIFQPDKNDNTNFAIARFDMDTFKFDQVANGVYNIKLKIRECW